MAITKMRGPIDDLQQGLLVGARFGRQLKETKRISLENAIMAKELEFADERNALATALKQAELDEADFNNRVAPELHERAMAESRVRERAGEADIRASDAAADASGARSRASDAAAEASKAQTGLARSEAVGRILSEADFASILEDDHLMTQDEAWSYTLANLAKLNLALGTNYTEKDINELSQFKDMFFERGRAAEISHREAIEERRLLNEQTKARTGLMIQQGLTEGAERIGRRIDRGINAFRAFTDFIGDLGDRKLTAEEIRNRMIMHNDRQELAEREAALAERKQTHFEEELTPEARRQHEEEIRVAEEQNAVRRADLERRETEELIRSLENDLDRIQEKKSDNLFDQKMVGKGEEGGIRLEGLEAEADRLDALEAQVERQLRVERSRLTEGRSLQVKGEGKVYKVPSADGGFMTESEIVQRGC
jgi:hypothetical protein